MKIGLLQINQTVGDLAGNARLIADAVAESARQGGLASAIRTFDRRAREGSRRLQRRSQTARAECGDRQVGCQSPAECLFGVARQD